MILPVEPRRIVVVAHRPDWSDLFAKEKAALLDAIGGLPCVLDIQHVGSTSVPGLVAKPVIDIGIGITSFEEAVVCIAPVSALGYVYRGECGIARRHYFSRDNPASTDAAYRRTHHIHMFETMSREWKHHIAFRDALRCNPELASQYAALKQELARRFPEDTAAYCSAKTAFITNAVDRYLAGTSALHNTSDTP